MDDIADGVSSLFLQEGSVVSINHMDLDLTITYLNHETKKKIIFSPLHTYIVNVCAVSFLWEAWLLPQILLPTLKVTRLPIVITMSKFENHCYTVDNSLKSLVKF